MRRSRLFAPHFNLATIAVADVNVGPHGVNYGRGSASRPPNQRAALRLSGYEFAEFKNPAFSLLARLVGRGVGSFWPRRIKIDLVGAGAPPSQGDEGTEPTHARSTPKPRTQPLATAEQRWEGGGSYFLPVSIVLHLELLHARKAAVTG